MASVVVEIDGVKWTMNIDTSSQHTLMHRNGNQLVAYNAVITAVME